jgi:hypothetical protein
MTNNAKDQLARVGKQAYLESFIYELLIEHSQQELQSLEHELTEMKKRTGNVDQLKKLVV